MRSRYSAFAVGDADYLVATWHPSTRPASLDLTADVQWQQLDVLQTAAGGPHDDEGIVEFAAFYWDPSGGQRGLQQERSAFVREDGQWFYVGPVADA